jgi:hypothetical protein
MKKLGFLTLLMAIAVMLGVTALAQDYSRYFTTYYSNANTANAPDATVRIINDGSSCLDYWAAGTHCPGSRPVCEYLRV